MKYRGETERNVDLSDYVNDDAGVEPGMEPARWRPMARDIRTLRLADLLPNPAQRRRVPLVIAGEPVAETLRERITRETAELEQACMLLAGQLARRAEQLEHLKRYPEDDPFEDGDVLSFVKTFPNSDQEYSYVAHRTQGLWYLTGRRSPQDISWSQLVDFMGLGVDVVWKLGGRGGRKRVIG